MTARENEPDKNQSLRADTVTVTFEGVLALSEVNIEVRKGSITGLIGPNGAGKTTLVNVVSGFQSPTTGSVLFNGGDVTGFPPHVLRRMGIARTFQTGRLFGELTVSENVEVTCISMGLGRRKAGKITHEVLQWIGIEKEASTPTAVLAYTDQRRVGIARALGIEPAYLLLDEPAAGMSDHECDDLMSLIKEIPSRFGCGVLLIEHNMGVVMNVCSSIYVLDSGRTISHGTPKEVQSSRDVIEAYLGVESF
jgi:branched-chain amino acid transport system ATP-binding protein